MKGEALRLLAGLEGGGMSAADAILLAEDLDPVLVYVIVTFLRRVYPAADPAASAVLERVVQLTRGSRKLVRSFRQGGDDSVARWFESEYGYNEFRHRGADLVELIADKLES